ncbi:MAG: M1 family metallopeptidase [Bacteroidia bacterium]
MNRFIIFLFLFTATGFLFAQKIYTTLQAPWQQLTDYSIDVKLDDENHVLRAFEKISYTNHSPDALKVIYIHLWPNAYKNNETEYARQALENGSTDFYFSSPEQKGWIDSLNFKVNGEKVKWYLLDTIDIGKIELNTPLKPGEQIEITTPFKVKIPKVFSRFGHEGQLYCISQWYPKPAVYDVNGWNYFPYLDEGEFYSEFGKFDVRITVPKNYVVAATGNLQNEEEKKWLFQKTKYNKTAKKTKPKKGTESFPTPESSKEFKTLHFLQDSVHDFAWFCDKRFLVDQSLVILKSGKKVNTFLYHIDPSQNSVFWIDSAVSFYSRLVGEYPYSVATAVVTPLKAGAGMEYPTITNVDKAGSDVIIHEVGHNWFYGILANNERIFPWMDESINTYYETRFEYKKAPAIHRGVKINLRKRSLVFGESPFGFMQLNYLFSARENSDQPVNLPATAYDDRNYGTMIYNKAPLMFHMLQDYLGDSLFDAMMQSYYEKWKFRHPLPDDFFDHAKKFTGKNLDWFLQYYSSNIEPDYKIVSLHKNILTVKNKSSIAAPFPVSRMIKDSVISTKWFEGFTGKDIISIDTPPGDKLRIDAYETTLDIYRNNNTIRTHGIFKKTNPIQFKFLGDIDNPYKTQIYYAPIIGANMYDKAMAGMALYNGLLPQRKFDFVLAPMYSFGTSDVVGYLNLEGHINTDGVFEQIHMGVNGSRFAFNYFPSTLGTYIYTYNKIEPYFRFDVNKDDERSVMDHTIQLRSVILLYNRNINSNNDPYTITATNARIDELSYFMNNKKAVNKNSLRLTFQNIVDNVTMMKFFAEFKQTIHYDQPKKKLDMRFFGGTFLTPTKEMPSPYYYHTTGNNGTSDYTFDHALIGRSEVEGFFSQQLIEKDGNMHIPLNPLYTDSWMISGNFVSTIPGPVPIRIFADLGYINSKSSTNTTSGTTYSYTPTFQYVAGLKLVLLEDIIEVNFPLFNSDDIENYYSNYYSNYKNENSFEHLVRKITFTLNLNKLNPIKYIREVSF